MEAVAIGQIRRVRIGHDGRGGGCGWFLDKVIVKEEGQTDAKEFPCNRCISLGVNTVKMCRAVIDVIDESLLTAGGWTATRMTDRLFES